MDNIYFNINFFLIIINYLLCLKNYNKLGFPFKILIHYLGFIILFILILKYNYKKDNHIFFVSHFFFTGQFLFLSIFYLKIMKEKITKKIIRFFLFFIPVVLIIQYSNNPSLWNRFNLFEIYSISFLIITYVLFHFYDMLNDEKYFFYNSVAILLYQLSTVVIYSTGNLFLKYNPNMNLFTFDLTNIFGIGSQLFLFFGWRHFYLTVATDEK